MTLLGKAVIYSTGAMTFTGGIVNATSPAVPTSRNVTRTADFSWQKNESGDTISGVCANKRKEAEITVAPYSTATTGAASALEGWTVAPGTLITVVDAVSGATDAWDDVWIVTQSRQSRTIDGIATVDLSVTAFDDNEVAAAIT